MTIKQRLFWSNIFMILIPAATALLVGAVCIGVFLIALLHGTGIGIRDLDEFEVLCTAITSEIEEKLEQTESLSNIKTVLDQNEMSLQIVSDGRTIYGSGQMEADSAMIEAVRMLDHEATIYHDDTMLYAKRIEAGNRNYIIYLTGVSKAVPSSLDLKSIIAGAIFIVFILVVLSVFLTNRILIRFVWEKIEQPLDLLSQGVHELRDGNLDYRISYDKQDEFLPVCLDFNEMARHLKELVEQQQYQEKSRKELIAGISHDIRSPLTSILAYVEGLLDGVARTPQAQEKYLETIKAKAQDLDHIVAQLFLFSKMELREYQDQKRILRLDQLLQETVMSVREEYGRKGLVIHLDTEPVLWNADPIQVRRILINLLDNSVKYKHKQQGQVWITLRKTEKGICWQIEDDGPGVEYEALSHLFDLFYRADPSRHDSHQSSGLGLAIVKKACEQMNGKVKAVPSQHGGLMIQIDLMKEEEHEQDLDCRG